MARPLVSDELWELIEPLIPKVARRHRFPGRKRLDDRKVLTGILFVLQTGIPWEYLPQEMGCGSGMTCWRRLAAWNEAGVWDELHLVLLKKLRGAKSLDWSRVVIDSSHVWAARAAPKRAGSWVTTPLRRPPGRELTPTQQTVNRALSAARAPAERGVARLKAWRIFRGSRCSPNRMTSIAAAVLTLEQQR